MSGAVEGLRGRGRALWEQLNQDSEHSPSGVLALEACRTADRLDALADVIAGGDLSVLQEARLQSAALKVLLESPVLKVLEAGKVSPVDDLAAQRAARRAAAQGSHGA